MRSRSAARRIPALFAALAGAALLAAGCRQGMANQPKVKPLAKSDFYPDALGARIPPAGTVARGNLREDRVLYAGQGADGKFVSELPPSIAVTPDLLRRGRQQFNVFCSPCHSRQGNGLGMIVLRGFKQPSSFHVDRLRQQPIGYYYDVMTNGFGQMSGYAAQVPVPDRWAIAAWIRVLQFSQHAPTGALSDADRAALEKAGPAVVTGVDTTKSGIPEGGQ